MEGMGVPVYGLYGVADRSTHQRCRIAKAPADFLNARRLDEIPQLQRGRLTVECGGDGRLSMGYVGKGAEKADS